MWFARATAHPFEPISHLSKNKVSYSLSISSWLVPLSSHFIYYSKNIPSGQLRYAAPGSGFLEGGESLRQENELICAWIQLHIHWR
jgi:hypothetical protein